MGNAAASAASTQQGFLWLYPSSHAAGRGLRALTVASTGAAAVDAVPIPAWFEANPATHELHWEVTDLDDVVLEERDSKLEEEEEEAAPGGVGRGAIVKARSAPTDGATVSLAAVRSVRAHSGGSASRGLPFLFVVEGEDRGVPFSLTLQAPTAGDLYAWLATLRKYVVSAWHALPDPAVAVFASVRNNEPADVYQAMTASPSRVALRDAEGNTPLIAAAATGAIDVLKLLLPYACDEAYEGGPASCVGKLADVNLDGRTVLHAAVASGSFRAVRAVLSALARYEASFPSLTRLLHLQCVGGMSALHLALQARDLPSARALGEAGASCLLLDDARRSIAHYAATPRGALEPPDDVDPDTAACVRWVCAAAPELVDVEDSAGNTPLHTAAQFGRLECVEAFLRTAADVTLRNHAGHTPSSLAAGNDHPQCVRALQAYGGTVNRASALLLSGQRRAALAAAGGLSNAVEVAERMDRIAAVWDRVLDAANKRLDAAAEARSHAVTVVHPHGHTHTHPRASPADEAITRVPVTRVTPYTPPRPMELAWVKCVDRASGWCYFTSARGDSVWSGDPRSSVGFVVGDPTNSAWVQRVHLPSSSAYMHNTTTGCSEWVAAPEAAPEPEPEAKMVTYSDARSDDVWYCRMDESTGNPYFQHVVTGEAEWCHDGGLSAREVARLVGGRPEGNLWQRGEDADTHTSFFTNVDTLAVVWGCPL